MELTTGGNVLHISARAVQSFSEEIWVMKKEKGGARANKEKGGARASKTLARESPFES